MPDGGGFPRLHPVSRVSPFSPLFYGFRPIQFFTALAATVFRLLSLTSPAQIYLLDLADFFPNHLEGYIIWWGSRHLIRKVTSFRGGPIHTSSD